VRCYSILYHIWGALSFALYSVVKVRNSGLEAPISRTNISKNQINKVKLGDLLALADKQVVTNATCTLQEVQAEFQEGGIREVTLELRKRNPQLRKQVIAKYGHRCQVCGFSFEEFYGELGAGYIEIHHLDPLSGRGTDKMTSIEDVTVVCANCHRVLHRNGKVSIPLDELQKVIKRRNQR
jgi:predicted HNH restriction endonuclease